MAQTSNVTSHGIELLYSDSQQRRSDASRSNAAKEIERLKKLAKWMDSAFEVPLIKRRVGLDSLIGLVPGIGDAATSAISSFIVLKAINLGVRKRVVARMLGNMGIDFVVGTIPLVGDLFDVAFKANSKNVKLLQRELSRQTDSFVGSQG